MPRLDDVQRAALADWWNLAQGAVADGWTTTQLTGTANYLANEADRTLSFQENSAIATLYGYAKRMANAADAIQGAAISDTITPDMIAIPPWARDEQVMNTVPTWHIVFEMTTIDSAGNLSTDTRTIVDDMTFPSTVGYLQGMMDADAEALAAKYNVQLVSTKLLQLLAVLPNMTEAETVEWLDFPPGTKIKQAVIDGMAEVNAPITDDEHIAAFRAFLACAGRPGDRIVQK